MTFFDIADNKVVFDTLFQPENRSSVAINNKASGAVVKGQKGNLE